MPLTFPVAPMKAGLGTLPTDDERWAYDCPFDPLPPVTYRRTARWVAPHLTATIEMTEFTNDGLVRHASFIELHEGTH